MPFASTVCSAWAIVAVLADPAVQTAAAPDADAELARKISVEAAASIRNGPAAGIAVGVLRGGATLFCGGFGFADLENEVPVTERTYFRLASVTKQFTAAAVLQLVEDGTLALDDPLSSRMPRFRAPGGDPTLLQLLNHSSGIRSLTSLPDFRAKAAAAQSVEDVLKMFDGLPADFAPGEGFEYNNSAYVLAGEIAARAAGVDYPTLIEQRIFAPLGMSDSAYASERRLIPRRARGYAVEAGKLVPSQPMNMEVPRGAGALGSTARDLLKWARALPALEVVGDESLARMTEPTRLGPDVVEYGLGLQRGHHGAVPWFGHGGSIEGFDTWIEWLPEQDVALVVLVNTEGNQARQLAGRLVALLAPASSAPSGAASGGATDGGAAASLDAARAARCLGRYVGGEIAVTIARAGGSDAAGPIVLTAQLPGQQPVPLRLLGEKDGRLDFVVAPDPTQHLRLEPDVKPARATIARPLGLRRLARADS
jgi:CubicO group peptidase (beta-lactamase class C family)